jgi:hypothetical protein
VVRCVRVNKDPAGGAAATFSLSVSARADESCGIPDGTVNRVQAQFATVVNLIRRRVGPFPGRAFAGQRSEQADVEAASRRFGDVADDPVASGVSFTAGSRCSHARD